MNIPKLYCYAISKPLARILIVGIFAPLFIWAAGSKNSPDAQSSFHLSDGALKVVLKGNHTYEVTRNGIVREFPQQHQIKLRYRQFDPLKQVPQGFIEDHLRAYHVNPAQQEAYIVQFVTQTFESYQKKIESLGGTVHAAQPEHAVIVHMNAAAREALEKQPFVRWVGLYQPAYKLEEGLDQLIAAGDGSTRQYTIMSLSNTPEMKAALINTIAGIGGAVESAGESRLLAVRLNAAQLGQLARAKEVLFIERQTPKETDLDQIRQVEGANYLERVAGYTGQGVRAEVMDSGLRTTHRDFQRTAPMIHGANGSSTSHGTAVFGIVFGRGSVDPKGRGLLPDAEQPFFAGYNSFSDRYAHTKELVDPAGTYRAVFQTNSWGNARTREYTNLSAEMDEILFDQDIVILQSQSNAGNQDSRPQAWAKNMVSIGGVRGYNTLDRSDDCWCRSASVGPASDGRIKPDLSNFYGDIFTTSDASDQSYREFGGTSGATPATAGHFGLMFQMWADGVFAGNPGQKRDVFNSRPHMTTAKALMIHSAWQYPFNGRDHDLTRVNQGWGFPDIKNLYDLAKNNGWRLSILIDENRVIEPLETHKYNLNVIGGQPLKATLVYADPAGNPNSTRHLVNDLSLKLTSPGGDVYWGNVGLLDGNWSQIGGAANHVDNVENVFIQNPQAGIWTISVIADAIVQDGHLETLQIDADYALVVSGGQQQVSDIKTGAPAPAAEDFVLEANYPNPFNPETQIRYHLKSAAEVALEVYDMTGRKIKTLISAPQNSGTHTVRWDARDEDGRRVASGMYLYRLKVITANQTFSQVNKMILLK